MRDSLWGRPYLKTYLRVDARKVPLQWWWWGEVWWRASIVPHSLASKSTQCWTEGWSEWCSLRDQCLSWICSWHCEASHRSLLSANHKHIYQFSVT